MAVASIFCRPATSVRPQYADNANDCFRRQNVEAIFFTTWLHLTITGNDEQAVAFVSPTGFVGMEKIRVSSSLVVRLRSWLPCPLIRVLDDIAIEKNAPIDTNGRGLHAHSTT